MALLDWEQDTLDSINEELADWPNCTWTQFSEAAPTDPNKDWVAGEAAPTPYAVKVAIFPINSRTRAGLEFMSGTEIPDGFIRGLMTGDCGFTPSLKDKLTASNGKTYSVDYMDIYEPAGNALAYVLGLKP